MKTTRPWSYSQLNMFETCALQYRFKYVDHAPTLGADTFYRDRGIAIHEKAEIFMKRRTATKVPDELTKLEFRLNAARKLGAKAEMPLYLDKRWNLVGKGKHWGVVKADLHWVLDTTLVIVDLKSGKPHDYTDQGRIYIAGFWSLYPNVLTHAYAVEWYTKTGESRPIRPVTYNRIQVLGIRREIEQRVKLMQAERNYDPTPSAACRWCDFSKLKGGPCKYG